MLKHSDLTQRIIGFAFQVHNTLGPGFHESVYQNGMEVELYLARIPFEHQFPIHLGYRGFDVGDYRADLYVADKVIVELKAIRAIDDSDFVQLLNYLRVSNAEVGLLINFGPRRVELKRAANTPGMARPWAIRDGLAREQRPGSNKPARMIGDNVADTAETRMSGDHDTDVRGSARAG